MLYKKEGSDLAMDTQTFGSFVAQCRREKQLTQAELAAALHVTDKAVSRWERGVGYPDIATLEPLAAALGVSVLELMHGRRMEEQQMEKEKAEEIVMDTLEMAKAQGREERKNALAVLGMVASADLIILLLDNVGGRGDVLLMLGAGVFFPILCAGGALALLGVSLWRMATGRRWGQTAVIALALVLGLTLVFGFFLLAGSFGWGPVPN